MKIKYKLMTVILLIGSWWCASPVYAKDKQYDQINAIFIYNFTNFIKWPNRAYETKESNLTVCLFGDISFEKELRVFDGVKVRDRQISIVTLKTIEQLKRKCHILYVGDDKVTSVAKIMQYMQHEYILSVADMDNFIKKGGMLNILRVSDGKKFIVNLKKIMEHGLEVSADFLEIAEVVE